MSDAGGKLLIVDYSTTWCGPCKMMAPKFDDMSNRYTDAVFVKVCTNTREGRARASQISSHFCTRLSVRPCTE